MGIFEPFRALGYITDNVPFAVQRRGLETFVTVSVGKAFQIFNVGPQLEKKLRALACWRDYTYAASGRSIFVFRRSHLVTEWCAHESKVVSLLCLANCILSIDSGGWMFVWEATSLGTQAIPVRKIRLEEGVVPTCLVHPATYVNKIVVGSEEGSLYLLNISTGKLLYKFKGWGSPVQCCASSPALHTIAVGCADGKIHVHNIYYDESVVTFTHTTRGAVTALSFRTDGKPMLAAGSSAGMISIWDLEKKKLQTIIKDAHELSVSALHFFPNEPVLLSAAADNSLKMWIFDSADGEARLLRFRSGHSAPPTCMRYYGNGRHILSAGHDRAFRVFSTIQDQQSRELSQGHIAKRAKKLKLKEEELKLPPIVCFDAAEIRERDWCNVVTCHADEGVAYSWRLQNFVIGEHILKPTVGDAGSVSVCALSTCGNFVVIGTTAGHVERFNIQSGLSRLIYQDSSNVGSRAHKGSVVGLASDATNTMIVSGGYDTFVKVWDFKLGKLISCWSVGSPLVKLVFHRGSGLIGTTSDDMIIQIYDVISTKLVRKFTGHSDRITDICFSEDGKWILSSGMDGSVRIWDLVSFRQLDAMSLDDPVTSLSLSPGMDMLATTHVGHNGIYLWANRLIFSGEVDSVCYGSGKDVVKVSLPTVSPGEEEETGEISQNVDKIATAESQQLITIENKETFSNRTQIMPELVTLSLLPKSQWQSLVNLDIIKMRNKPIEPPKKPEKAPFFLPTLPSLSGQITFASSTAGNAIESGNSESQKNSTSMELKDGQPPFLKLLYSFSSSGDYGALLSYLKGLSPAEIDMEFQMLRVVNDMDLTDETTETQLKEIRILLDFLLRCMRSNNDFEFVQALTRLFLKIHGEIIVQQPVLQEKAKELLKLESSTWQKLDGMFQDVRCTLSFLSNALY